MTKEDDSWTQTLITVTPENDAVLREIAENALLSGRTNTPLDLNTDNIVFRRPLTFKHLLDPLELEQESTKDAENQTYLQGVPIVEIPVKLQDEASQTLYMSSPCPPIKHFKHIMTSMNDIPPPEMKVNKVVQTIVTCDPEVSQVEAIDQLITVISSEEQEEFWMERSEREESEMEVTEVLYFLLKRVLWITDPLSQTQSERTKNEEVQTFIAFNYGSNKIVMDNETQTGLTCEPKQSNTKLLSDYRATKDLVQSCFDDCFNKGIEPRIIVDDIIDEITNKCANRVRYPMRSQVTQTVASYKIQGKVKDEDVLRKLRLPVVVDPFEASIVVVPLINDTLKAVHDSVINDAGFIVDQILKIIIQRTVFIGEKRFEIRRESQPKPMDQILDQRRKKILESMLKRSTGTTSTQTGIAGVPEVSRIKEPKEVVCSVCLKESSCHWCGVEGEKQQDVPIELFKTLNTRDILLTYKPCYMTTHLENDKQPERQAVTAPVKQETKKLPQYSESDSTETIDIIIKPERKIKPKDSVSGWSQIIDTSLARPWSVKGSASSVTRNEDSSRRSGLSCRRYSKSQSGLASETARALEILKSTFCTQGTCTTGPSLLSLKSGLREEGEMVCTRSICSQHTRSTSSNFSTSKEDLSCYRSIKCNHCQIIKDEETVLR